MIVLDSEKMLRMSVAFKAATEAAAVKAKLSWSAWARQAMQRQMDQQRQARRDNS